MQKREEVIVIGAGLGGLMTAYIMCKEGYQVTVLEKNARIGGAIQSFAREGVTFNTGFNYTESLRPGEVLHEYFSYFDLMNKVEFKQLNRECHDLISFGDTETQYKIPSGKEAFINSLVKEFPEEEEAITTYYNTIERIANSFPMYRLDGGQGEHDIMDILDIGIYDFLSSITDNERLKNVIAGTCLLYGGDKEKSPLYLHALINYSFIKSAWRIVGGGSKLAVTFMRDIEAMGGKVYRRKEVNRISGPTPENTDYTIHCSDESSYQAKYIISNIHPSTTLNLLEENVKMRKAYVRRLHSLENTIGMFTLYVVLKPDTFEYQNYNIHHFTENNVWTTKNEEWPSNFLFYTPAEKNQSKYAKGVEILSYMNYADVEQWNETTVGNRGDDYEAFKKDRAERLLNIVEKRVPGFRSKIQSYYSSTPLTYRDYTGTKDGGAFGIQKDHNNALACIINPQSPAKNLLYTGQNLNVHGILGVTIGAFATCEKILGNNVLLDQIKQNGK